jgi:hypothetical protein
MDKELERAYDALMQADAAGNKEDAQQIADYIRTLETQKGVPGGETSVKQVSDADLVNVLTPTIGGAIAGEVVGPIVNKGVEAVQSTKPGAFQGSAAPRTLPPGTPFNPRGVTIEQSVQNWENYGQAQNEAAKRVRREAELHKKYPGFTRAQPPTPAATPSAMSQLRQAIPGPIKTAGQFLGGAAQSGVVPWLGRAVAGGAAGYQGADAYNRLRQGDVVGGGLSTIGALGAGASFFPHPAARYGGAAISAGAEGLNQYLDYLKRKSQQPAAAQPQPQQQEQMPVPMKEGGLASYAKGKAVKEVFNPVVTKIVKASEALGPNEGKFLRPTQSDRMRSTMGDLGGPGFPKFQLENPKYAEAQAVWGVGKKGTASGIVNANKKYNDQTVWTPMIGGPTQHHSNQHVFDKLVEEFNRQTKMGNLPKDLQEKINARLASSKTTKGMFPEEFDIGNPEHLAKYGDTFDRRGALSTILSGEGVGGAKGRIIDYPDIMQEMTDPMTIGAPTHSLGTRLFTLNNEIEYRPDLHSAFPYILKGTDQGVAFAPIPKELGLPDFINQFREFKNREPGYYDLVRTIPSQQITDKYLRSLEAAGYKEGGSTTPAWQRKEGKSPSGGLNALGRASYKRETGGELKAPQPEGGSRKKSFCARMGGMKKKLTSSETANDPDSRINKALRKWKC